MKKYVKYTLITTAFLGTTGIIIGFSRSWTNMPTISVGGSSAVSPLITEYSNIYNKSDIVVQTGGSGAGISYALDGKKNIGMASKNPKALDNPELVNRWKSQDMKTITIAWDGIGIVYKPINKNDTLDITKNNINNIYNAFAGLSVSAKDIGIGNSETIIKTFARDGGAIKSGTADAFLNDSGLGKPELTEVQNILKNGSYGKNTTPTSESNVEAWESAKDKNISGSMVYLSSGFIVNNIKEITDAGFKVATYNSNNLVKDKIANGYNWYRPFNLIVSLKTINNAVKEFIDWTLTSSTSRDNILNSLGFNPLTNQQVSEMGDKSSFWNSDDEVLGKCGVVH